MTRKSFAPIRWASRSCRHDAMLGLGRWPNQERGDEVLGARAQKFFMNYFKLFNRPSKYLNEAPGVVRCFPFLVVLGCCCCVCLGVCVGVGGFLREGVDNNE